MTNDKDYMREYQRLRRMKLKGNEDKRTTGKYVEWINSWYKQCLMKNKEALRRYENNSYQYGG